MLSYLLYLRVEKRRETWCANRPGSDGADSVAQILSRSAKGGSGSNRRPIFRKSMFFTVTVQGARFLEVAPQRLGNDVGDGSAFLPGDGQQLVDLIRTHEFEQLEQEVVLVRSVLVRGGHKNGGGSRSMASISFHFPPQRWSVLNFQPSPF